jgi:hypothetical protein
MRTFAGLLVLIALETAAGPGILPAAELQPAAYSAWQAYLQTAGMRMQARLAATGRFLWIDEEPGRDVRARNGAILVAPGLANGTQAVPNGLIHHWVAAVFIPFARLGDVLQIAHNFASYQHFYHPAIVDSKVLGSAGGEQSFSMRSLHRVLFITAVLDSQFITRDVQVDATRWYIVADSTRVQEVENFGGPDERVLPPDHGKGFIWRLHTITRYEERDGGVYVEMEALALSRDIPVALRWVVNPAVDQFSRGEMMACLRQTREAVTAVTTSERRVDHSLAINSVAVRTRGERQ